MTPRILLLDLYGGGHHGFYLDVLCAGWKQMRLPVELHVGISADFAARHADVLETLDENTGVHVVETVPDDASLLHRDRLHGQAMQHLVDQTGATHAVFLYWDHAQVSTATGLRFKRPVHLAGCYFRPSFHYGALGGPQPSFFDRLMALRKRLVLRSALRNPHLQRLFCLDPYVVTDVDQLAGRPVAVPLPDPVRSTPTEQTVRSSHASVRQRLLIFGVLDHRKGILPACEALLSLPPEQQARLTLALHGPLEGPDTPEIRRALDALRSQSRVEVELDDRFIVDDEIQAFVRQADLVLLLYQHHIGSSNVLVRAAAAQVPVLATDYGLVGAQVRIHRLGQTVDATTPHAIAQCIAEWLGQPDSIPVDHSKMTGFAKANTAEACATAFWNGLLSLPSPI